MASTIPTSQLESDQGTATPPLRIVFAKTGRLYRSFVAAVWGPAWTSSVSFDCERLQLGDAIPTQGLGCADAPGVGGVLDGMERV